MPTYCRNQEGLLRECVNSVLAQTMGDFEYVIIDDGSADGTEDVIRDYARKDPRIVYVRHDRNSGLPAVRTNEGILLARAPRVAFIFDDNVWVPDLLECLMARMDAEATDAVYCNTEMLLPGDKPSFLLGQWPFTEELLWTLNTIPNGGCLFRREFFEKYGLYDPHLILRRICDWDLWLRSYCQGARFAHLDKVSGTERGTASAYSIGNTVTLDYKVSFAYMTCRRSMKARTEALRPGTIRKYDVFDPEKVLPYVRDIQEWSHIEERIYRQFFDKHPDYQWQKPTWHNRRYVSEPQSHRLNPPCCSVGKRLRILMVANRLDRFVMEWRTALESQLDALVLVNMECQVSGFEPADVDLVILFDSAAAFLESFIRSFSEAGAPVIYVVNHGADVPIAPEKNALTALNFTEHAGILASLSLKLYFPVAGQPWNEDQAKAAKILRQVADHVLVFNGRSAELGEPPEKVREVAFVPNALPPRTPAAPAELVLYPGDLGKLEPEELNRLEAILKGTPAGRRWRVYCLGSKAWPAELSRHASKVQLVLTNDTLPTLARNLEGVYLAAPRNVLDRYASYEGALLEEDLARNGSVLVDLSAAGEDASEQFAAARLLARLATARERVVQRGRFSRPDARALSLANLALAAQFGKKQRQYSARGSQTFNTILLFINSPLLAGSEVYGLLIAQGLHRTGLDVHVAIPRVKDYETQQLEVCRWMAQRGLPPVEPLHYGMTQAGLLNGEPRQLETTFREFQAWLDTRGVGTVFTSCFIPEPLFELRRRLAFVAVMQPYGQLLDHATCLQYLAGAVFSDSQWSTRGWQRVAPAAQWLPSIVEDKYFAPPKPVPSKGTVRIAVGGTLQPRKRQIEAFEAVESLLEQGYDLKLNFYGHELECLAEYVEALRGRLGRSKHAGRVALHGLVPMEQIIADNDLLLMPSIDESMPQTMLLALAAGLPAVACPCGGIPDLIRPGETGFLAEGFSAEEIAAALKEALADRAQWPDRTARAQAILTRDYTEPIVMNRLLSAMVRGAEIASTPGAELGRRTPDRAGALSEVATVPPPKPVAVPGNEVLARLTPGPDLGDEWASYVLQSARPRLCGLQFHVGTHASSALTGKATLRVLGPDGGPAIREMELDLAGLRDNTWATVTFEPIVHSQNRAFRIEVLAAIHQGRFTLFEIRPAKRRTLYDRVARRLDGKHRSGQAFFPLYAEAAGQ
jgi:glycosyltransferase involved in cell wall biosynthesis